MNNLFKDKVMIGIIFIFFVFFSCVGYILIAHPFQIVYVEGSSMSPTLQDKQVLVFPTNKETIKRGDIVVFKTPESWNTDNPEYIKRVVAIPGDTVKVTTYAVFVNGELYVEFNGKLSNPESEMELTVPEGRYFVMGDNLGHSNDSLTAFLRGKDDITVSREDIEYIKSGVKRETE